MNELTQSCLFSSVIKIFEMHTEFFIETCYEEFRKKKCVQFCITKRMLNYNI